MAMAVQSVRGRGVRCRKASVGVELKRLGQRVRGLGPAVVVVATIAGWAGAAFAADDCPGDFDCDGVPNAIDNCVFVANPDQADPDRDLLGSVCDGCPYEPEIFANARDALLVYSRFLERFTSMSNVRSFIDGSSSHMTS